METQFEDYINKVNGILRSAGMFIDKEDSNRTVLNRLKYHWKCLLQLIFFQYGIFGQIVWLVLAAVTGKSLIEITFFLPCLTLSLLGDIRICSFIYHLDTVNDIIYCLKALELKNRPKGKSAEEEHKVWYNFLKNVMDMLVYVTYIGVTTFLGGPFVILALYYYTTGEVKIMLPFLVWYPFDALDPHFWPLAFIQQAQAAWMTIHYIIGPDSFFFTCCTFIHLQFTVLQEDLEEIVKSDLRKRGVTYRNNEFMQEFVDIVNRHRELIRCVELLEGMYSKSTLFSVATSSLTICASGFNIKILDNYLLIMSYLAVLILGLLQTNLCCYYGDYVTRSSMKVGDAIYNSRWYDAEAAVGKSLLIVLVRSQRACKFTASGYADVNLRLFSRILSSSWSYFALLNQIYQD